MSQPTTSNDLELVGTRELIAELLRRSTFQGVIVHSTEEAKQADWVGERVFSVRYSKELGAERAGRLLGAVSEYMALPGD